MTPLPQPPAYLDLSINRDELVSRVADTFVSFLSARLAHSRPAVHVCLTGGTVADDVHRAVAARLPHLLPWSKLHVWWGDERFVPSHSVDRNDAQAAAALLDALTLNEAHVHRFPTPASGQLIDVARVFSRRVTEQAPPRFDLVMLGTGEDGHVASLFPGHDDPAYGDVVAVDSSPKPPAQRMSLTSERLSRTDECWVVASGQGKAEAIAHAWRDPAVPLAEVSLRARRNGAVVTWFLDEDAAGSLQSRNVDSNEV